MATESVFIELITDSVAGLLWLLAVVRLTRLATVDEITDPIRVWAFGKFGAQSKIGYLMTCSWCMSIWIGFATAPYLIWLTGCSWGWLPLFALAASYAAGISASRIEDDDMDIQITDE
jgi:hypothetical protein